MQHCKEGTILTWYNNFLQEQSQYDGDIKAIKRVHHIEQFERQEELSIVQLLWTYQKS